MKSHEHEVKKLRIHILPFDDFETLDIFGPVEILAIVEENELVYCRRL
ncbi:MAG: hypothetical protein ACI4EH_02510 [Oliverpabstia sp.]